MRQPAICQVLTGWVKEPDGPEFLIGIFDHIELAQVARTAHTLECKVVYDYSIEPWVIEGRTEDVPEVLGAAMMKKLREARKILDEDS